MVQEIVESRSVKIVITEEDPQTEMSCPLLKCLLSLYA